MEETCQSNTLDWSSLVLFVFPFLVFLSVFPRVILQFAVYMFLLYIPTLFLIKDYISAYMLVEKSKHFIGFHEVKKKHVIYDVVVRSKKHTKGPREISVCVVRDCFWKSMTYYLFLSGNIKMFSWRCRTYCSLREMRLSPAVLIC